MSKRWPVKLHDGDYVSVVTTDDSSFVFIEGAGVTMYPLSPREADRFAAALKEATVHVRSQRGERA